MNRRQKKKIKKIKHMKEWDIKLDKKTRRTIDRNKKLIKRYPFLLPRNVWTDEMADDYYYDYTLYDSIPDGWRKSFGLAYMEELRSDLIANNYLEEFRILQIKEKYGQLRVYTGAIPRDSKVFDIIHKYERLSENVCMTCGKPAQIVEYCGWLESICEDCWNERENKMIRKGYSKERREYPKGDDYYDE